MSSVTRLAALLLMVGTTATSLPGQDPNQAGKRAALHEALVAPLNEPGRKQLVAQQINQLNDAQLDRLHQALLARIQQLEEIQQRLLAREQLAWQQARQMQWLWNQMQQNRGWGGRPVGFSPVVSWLPQGTNMTASAVVSPDRRYVRISVNPFFSSIGPVDTFNFNNGQTRRIYPGSYGPNGRTYSQPPPNSRPVQQTRQQPDWYKRIRTNR
jgi:hypothetical protein